MFEALSSFFYIILYQPLFNLLVVLYNYIPGHDFGIAVILLTLIIRFALYPTSVKAVHSQNNLQKLQPKILEVQKKYKDDKEKQAQEILNLYKKEKINPFSGLFLALLQLPILIALYQVFYQGFDPEKLSILYSFITNPGQLNPLFIQIIDLSKPNFVLAIMAGLTQYFQTKMTFPKVSSSNGQNKEADMTQMMQKQMTYFMPVFTTILLVSLPSALGLYWTVGSIFSIAQQYLVFKKKDKLEIVKP